MQANNEESRVRHRDEESSDEQQRVHLSIETDNCAICLESLSRGPRSVGTVSPCGHSYHETCFYAWKAAFLKNQDDSDVPFTCPLCNGSADRFALTKIPFTSRVKDNEGNKDEDCMVAEIVNRELWSSDIRVVVEALRLLLDVVKDEAEGVLQMGGHVSVIRALQRYEDDVEIQKHGLLCLVKLLRNYIGATLCLESGVHEIVLKSVEEHLDSSYILGVGSVCLAILCNVSGKILAWFIGKGGIRLVVEGVERFGRVSACPETFCLLNAISISSEENARAIADEGAIPLILDAMIRHQECAALQLAASVLLESLSRCSTIKTTIIDNDGLHVVAAAFRKYRDDEVLRERLCQTMAQLMS